MFEIGETLGIGICRLGRKFIVFPFYYASIVTLDLVASSPPSPPPCSLVNMDIRRRFTSKWFNIASRIFDERYALKVEKESRNRR